MQIHQRIRERRRQLGMTQEDLADALGVSAPAVNKWEKGINCPDIALLAPLARLLKTDLNELLGFYRELTPREVTQKTEAVISLILTRGFSAGEEQARKELREFPGSGALAFSLASVLESMLPADQRADRLPLIHSFYEKASRSEDRQIRALAFSRLTLLAAESGDKEQAGQYFSQLPEEPAIRKKRILARMQAAGGEKTAAKRTYQEILLQDGTELLTVLLHLLELAEGPEEAEALRVKLEQLATILDFPAMTLLQLKLQRAAEREEARETLRLLDEMLGANLSVPESILYSELAKKPSDPLLPEVLKQLLRKEIEEDPVYRYLREDASYPDWKRRQFPE